MKKNLTYLIAAVAFMLVSMGAMAQGGLTPLVGSTHEYTVTAADASNNPLTWSVVEGTAGTEYTINSGAATETVNITWNTAGTYHLEFKEMNATGCITLKQATVVVAANTFDVSTTDPSATCNAKDGTVNPTGDATTSITFTVDMTTANTSWSPNWEIDFTLSTTTGATFTNVAASSGTLTGTGPYNLTGLTSTNGDGTVNITLDVTGDAFALQNAALAITAAKELDYNTPDVDNNDWTALQIINPLPSTSDITTD
jgi:hypothetical protein